MIAPPPSPNPETEPVNVTMNAYERGLDLGLQTAAQQVTLAGELARTMLAAVPPAPPTRIIIQQPGPTIIRYVSPDYYSPPYSSFIAPYSPFFGGAPYWWGGYAYGFRQGRFVPHSHFFPCVHGPCRGLFFPHGHFFQDGFPVGHGIVVR
jgi:hypothetical protein